MKKILPFLLILAACQTGVKRETVEIKETIIKTEAPVQPAASVARLGTGELPFFRDTGEAKKFLKAAEQNKKYLKALSDKKILYSFGDRKITPILLLKTTEKLAEIIAVADSAPDINSKITENFDVYELKPSTNSVVFSSYYEPILEASLKKTKEYRHPIYAKPPDMVDVNLEEFNEKYRGERLTGRLKDGRLTPYFSRDEIDYKKLFEGKNLELAWFKSMADVMDIHIEGSGILKLTDGKHVKAKFAATNSLKFKGWMTALLEMGLMKREDLTAQSAKKFIDTHPDLERAVLSQNKRYTFFKLEEIRDPEEGPTGTYGYPLVGARSIAVDNSIIPMGTPAFMTTSLPDVSAEGVLYGLKEDSRFVFCQDTGGAIKGARVDFFAGKGPQAKTLAFSLWEKGRLYLLLIKESGDKI